MNKKCHAAVLFISGQSNAHAHGQLLDEKDRITVPMTNVFSLDREYNQRLYIQDVVWSGYTTEGKNLGETQDHTACFAFFFAKRWQNAINEGMELPDLYIVQLSIGSQGIINGMWNPDKAPVLKPGVHGIVDISLYSFARHINRLVMKNLNSRYEAVDVIGWHWFGSEQEVWNEVYKNGDFSQRYDFFFDNMLSSIGVSCPVYFYKIYLESFCKDHGLPLDASEYINRELLRQSKRISNSYFVKAEECPYWNEEDPTRGIFSTDYAHYLPHTQEWFAEKFWMQYARCN